MFALFFVFIYSIEQWTCYGQKHQINNIIFIRNEQSLRFEIVFDGWKWTVTNHGHKGEKNI